MPQGQWAGMVTDASPYALSAGAAAVQVNLSTSIPGQLTSRGGMRDVAFGDDDDKAPENVRDLLPYATPVDRALIALRSDGKIVLLRSPHAGSAPAQPTEPTLAPSGDDVASSYSGRFVLGPQASD